MHDEQSEQGCRPQSFDQLPKARHRDQLTLNHQLCRVRRTPCSVAGRAGIRPRVPVLHGLDDQDVRTVSERLSGQLPVHGDIPTEERPPDRHRRVSLVGVTGQVHLVPGPQSVRGREREDLRRLWNVHGDDGFTRPQWFGYMVPNGRCNADVSKDTVPAAADRLDSRNGTYRGSSRLNGVTSICWEVSSYHTMTCHTMRHLGAERRCFLFSYPRSGGHWVSVPKVLQELHRFLSDIRHSIV